MVKINIDQISSSQDIQLHLHEQGYGVDNPDIFDTHPAVVSAKEDEALAAEAAELRRATTAKEIREVGTLALSTIRVNNRGEVMTDHEYADATTRRAIGIK